MAPLALEGQVQLNLVLFLFLFLTFECLGLRRLYLDGFVEMAGCISAHPLLSPSQLRLLWEGEI